MFPAQATTHVIKLFPWHIRARMKEKQEATNKHLHPSFTISPLLPFGFLQCLSKQAKLQMNYCIFSSISLNICFSLPGMPQVGGVWMSFWTAQLDSVSQASCINTGEVFHWIAEIEMRWHWLTLHRVTCRVCGSMSGRQGAGGGEVWEMLQSIKWQMCRCASVVRFSREERVGVMLIKAVHLQPIKGPLSFIKANLLKHAARDVKTSWLVLHALSLPPSISLFWPVDGTWPSNPIRNASGCI